WCMGLSALQHIKPWWMVPKNFTFPLEFYIEEGQGKLMFGEPPGPDLARIIEVHSQTLIRPEARFTATGLTRVLVVGPAESRQWLFLRIWRLGSWDPQSRARGGREMLRFAQKLPLSPPDLAARPPRRPSCWTRRACFRPAGEGATVSLRPSQASTYEMFGSRRFRFRSGSKRILLSQGSRDVRGVLGPHR
uniref:KH-like RNA-binding domain-containing protein n=1 Tax=Phocoena sinus TaxID=42100 RepID=A0A8C9CFH4_PHOSS